MVKLYIGLHVKYPLILMTLGSSRYIFEKYIRFHEDSSRGSRIVPFGLTDRHGDACGRFSQVCERP